MLACNGVVGMLLSDGMDKVQGFTWHDWTEMLLSSGKGFMFSVWAECCLVDSWDNVSWFT